MTTSPSGFNESPPGVSSETTLPVSDSSDREPSEPSSWSSASTAKFSTASVSSDKNESSTLRALTSASDSPDPSPDLTMVLDNDTETFKLVLLPARSVATTENPTLSGRGSKASGLRRTSPLLASIDKPAREPSSSNDSSEKMTPDVSDADAV